MENGDSGGSGGVKCGVRREERFEALGEVGDGECAGDGGLSEVVGSVGGEHLEDGEIVFIVDTAVDDVELSKMESRELV